MTAAIYPSTLVSVLIAAYQRFVSPYKGFYCAYRVRRRRASCSEFARRLALRRGVLALPALLQERFRRCAAAAAERRHQHAENRSSAATTGDCTHAAGEACAHASCDLLGDAACSPLDGFP